MTRKNKIIVAISAGIIAIIAIILMMVFIFDTFGLFTSEYKLNYDKYVKIGDYKGLKYTDPKLTVSKAEVKKQIEANVQAKTSYKTVKTGIVKDGDQIDVDFDGKINGKTFQGGSAKNFNIVIGQTQMIDGFIDGLKGKKVGETVKLKLKFPEKYPQNTKLQNKPVVFTVKINSKQKKQVPKYNLDFVKKNSKCKSLAEYENDVKRKLLESKNTSKKAEIKKSLWRDVISKTEIKKYPKRQLKYEKEQFINRYKKMAKSYNMDWDKFLKTYMQSTPKKFDKEAESYAKDVVKQKLTMFAIAKKENLKVTDKEYKAYMEDLLKNAGFTKESFKKQYNQSIEDYGKDNDFKTNLLLQKVLNKVMEYGKAQ